MNAPLSRGFSGFAFEDDAEIFDMLETRALRDRVERQVRFNQELFYVIKPDLQDFPMRGLAQQLMETLLEDASR